ncbi:hypothetical protein FQA39_LY19345 [Lamprigera yunnana]|nr:hypothetical protein FQA39_LY19345 [Lamprigera yunnana]
MEMMAVQTKDGKNTTDRRDTFLAETVPIRLEMLPWEKTAVRFGYNAVIRGECSLYKMGDKNAQKTYEAKLVGDFKENQFPNEQFLELKIGAQMHVIRNDISGEKKYFNGKLGEIIGLDEDEIRVVLDESEKEITVKKETWEQKSTCLDTDKTSNEEVWAA